jgi:hypothetical protein
MKNDCLPCFPALGCLALLMATILNTQLSALAVGTAFTYQGRLADSGASAIGIYDLRFAIYDASGGGNLVAGPLTNSATGVTDGLFTVTLDFGGGVFVGAPYWLEIGVRTNGNLGPYVTLNPRQPLTPSPYAIFAGTAAGVASGSIGPNNLSPSSFQK